MRQDPLHELQTNIKKSIQSRLAYIITALVFTIIGGILSVISGAIVFRLEANSRLVTVEASVNDNATFQDQTNESLNDIDKNLSLIQKDVEENKLDVQYIKERVDKISDGI